MPTGDGPPGDGPTGGTGADVTPADDTADGTASRDGRSTRWDPHRAQRRAAIVAAAIEAIERSGPDVVTAQIAELAGVPRTHVYRHFDGKQALDLAVSSAIANDIGSHVRRKLVGRGSVRAIIAASIDEHLGWIEAHPHLYRFLAQHAYAVQLAPGAGAADAKAAFAAELTELIKSYMRALGVDTEPADRLIVGVVALVDATAAWWLDHRTPDRGTLTTELTERAWLVIDGAARSVGLSLDPDRPLPKPERAPL